MICSAKVIICKKVLNFLQSLGSRSKEDKRVFGDDTFLLRRIQMSTVLDIKYVSYFELNQSWNYLSLCISCFHIWIHRLQFFFYLDIFMAKHTNKLQGLQMYISHLCSQFKYAKKEIKAKQKLLCSYNALILFFIPIIEETISAKMCFAQSQNWDTTKNGNQFLRVYVCIYTSFCTLFHFYILHFSHISFRTHNRIFVCRRFWQTY